MHVRLWAAAAVFSFLVISIWYWIVNRPVQTIGNSCLVTAGSLLSDPCPKPDQIYEAHIIGSPLDICLDNIVWFRVCPSMEFVHLVDARGSLYNLPNHPISHPQGPITIKHKCRAWGPVPHVAPGLAKITGYIESYCPMVTIITQMPEMALMVREGGALSAK